MHSCIHSSLSVDHLIALTPIGHNKDSLRMSQTCYTVGYVFTLCTYVVISHLSLDQCLVGLLRSNVAVGMGGSAFWGEGKD